MSRGLVKTGVVTDIKQPQRFRAVGQAEEDVQCAVESSDSRHPTFTQHRRTLQKSLDATPLHSMLPFGPTTLAARPFRGGMGMNPTRGAAVRADSSVLARKR